MHHVLRYLFLGLIAVSMALVVTLLDGCGVATPAPKCGDWVQACIYNQSAAFTPSKPENADACVRAAKQIGVCK